MKKIGSTMGRNSDDENKRIEKGDEEERQEEEKKRKKNKKKNKKENERRRDAQTSLSFEMSRHIVLQSVPT